MKSAMRPSDLGELYALLAMYRQTYGGIGDRFLSDVADNYREAAKRLCRGQEGEGIPPVTNPRAAGRKARNNAEEARKILELRKEGRTIRDIASETGRSVGYVHKLIREHGVKTA